jgi:predicted nuclease of predicted toxin-antitoxin system
MHFLIDASVPRSAGAVLRQLGHEATDVRDAGMRDAPDDIIATYARDNHLVLVTRDFDFADIRNYPPSLYEGIVVLKLQEDATAKQVAALLASFAGREDWLKHLTGRLAIVETWRVRFRPA